MNGIGRDFDRVALFEIHEDGYLDLFSQHTELFDGGRTIGVAGCENRSAVLLRFEEKGKFSRKGGLTRTVKAGHEDDGRSMLQTEVGSFSTHQRGQFVVHNLDHELRRLHGGEHVLSECFLLDGVGETLGHFVVDVSVKEGTPHVFEGFGHVDFGDAAFTFEDFERPLESFAEIIEHKG